MIRENPDTTKSKQSFYSCFAGNNSEEHQIQTEQKLRNADRFY